MRAVTIAIALSLVVTARPGRAQDKAAEKPALAILELGGGSDIKWADVKTPHVELPLTIENVDKPLSKVTVDVTPFNGPGGTVEPLINGRPGPLTIGAIDAGGRSTATISADLPASGAYHALVSLRDARKTVLHAMIEIVRVRSAAPLEIGAVPAQIVDLDARLRSQPVTFTIPLKGAGQKVQLDAPALKSAEYKEKVDSKVSVGAPSVKVTLVPSMGFTMGDQPQTITATIADVGTPGQYDVVVALGGAAYSPLTATLTFYARQSMYVASISIFLGVLLSLFLRYYSIVGRPTLVNKQRANRLFRELDEHAALARDNERALSLIQDLRRKLAESWDGLSRAGKLTDAQALEVYEAKVGAVPQWLQLWRRVARVSPASVAAPFQKQLLDVETALRDRNADLASVKTQTAILDGMLVAIDAAMTKELLTQIATLGARFREDSRFAGLLSDLEKTAADLAETPAAGANPATLEAAAQSLDALQRRYFVLVVGDLAARLGHEPVGAGATWTATLAAINDNIKRVRDAASATDASAAFRSALTLYLRTVVEGLLSDIADRVAANSPFKDRYSAVGTRLEAIGPLIASGDVVEAWKKLEQAQATYRNIREEAGGGAMGVGAAALEALAALGAAPSAAAEIDIATIALGGSTADSVARPGAGAALEGWRHLGDLVSSALILLGAILIGLQTLWVGNPTWGGGPSILAAFLWGLTFDQVSHAGLVALLKRT